ncbi:MAG: putative metalloprotease with PDZ domain [Gammaproteobacteria bacterium]|jgi:predicted metalloprotease with PDZ domain
MNHYQISSRDPASHYFNVSLTIPKPDSSGQRIRLPNWIPGSYMIRDFSRHIVSLDANAGGKTITITQLDKSNWQIEATDQAITVEYLVYANDLSVRGAHLDNLHGYFNGCSVFLEVVDQAESSCMVQIDQPSANYCKEWKLATAMTRRSGVEFGFGQFEAENYDELIDHPVEMGRFKQIRFEACGVPHDMILTGRFELDEERLAHDLKIICEHHIRFFGEPAPMPYYQFQTLVVGNGYGGLEHRASTSLICARDSLPQKGQAKISDGYRDFLGLCSHEYFHTWNVKRIKPAVYQTAGLQNEVYTGLLWAFEGITSYYDDLALLRCGLIDETTYLELLAQTLTRVSRGKGSRRQSAYESSFNAWTKFYKQDENSPNAIVSYYAKGALIALCIDLKMRAVSDSAVSLDDVMRELWKRWKSTQKGVDDDDIQSIILELTNDTWRTELDDWIQAANELPVSKLLDFIGVDCHFRSSFNQKDLGGKLIEDESPLVSFGAHVEEADGMLNIIKVEEDGAAQLSGLSAGDSIIAINGLKVSLIRFEEALGLAQPDDCWKVHAFRRDELYDFEVSLQVAKQTTVFFQSREGDFPARNSWAGQ